MSGEMDPLIELMLDHAKELGLIKIVEEKPMPTDSKTEVTFYLNDGTTYKVITEIKEIQDFIEKYHYRKVVLCKDCIHHEDEEPRMVYCPKIMGSWVDEDFYCGAGEEKK